MPQPFLIRNDPMIYSSVLSLFVISHRQVIRRPAFDDPVGSTVSMCGCRDILLYTYMFSSLHTELATLPGNINVCGHQADNVC